MAAPTLLDRLVGWVSPVSGARRMAARLNMEAMGKAAGGYVPQTRRRSASDEGTLGSWHPRRENRWQADGGLDATMTRAESLVANDGHAESCVTSLALNVVGGGMAPQCYPDAAVLGISEDAADAFATSAERAWELWCEYADAGQTRHFGDIQFEAVRSMFVTGEFLHLPIWEESALRPFGLALQTLHPARLRTPSDMMHDTSIRCGIKMGRYGEPLGYYIANPPSDCVSLSALTSRDFCFVPRMTGHRCTCLHGFHVQMPEQNRGVSILSPAMKLFRDLSDYVDYQLVGAMIAASFTVFVETPQDLSGLGGFGDAPAAPASPNYPDALQPGTMTMGKAGHKPHIISSDRPGANFDAFYERILRAAAASTGQPYEQVSKDFSKTNYSSARAALLEVWKLHKLYQDWFVRDYLSKIWDMVIEEAWLRGMLEVPAGAPSLYDSPALWRAWLRCVWTRPPRGQIDPVKERKAEQIGLETFTDTRTAICHARGLDFDTLAVTRKREEQKLRALGLLPETPAPSAQDTETATDDPEDDDESDDAKDNSDDDAESDDDM